MVKGLIIKYEYYINVLRMFINPYFQIFQYKN